MAYKLSWESDHCVVHYFGECSDRDLAEARRELHGDPRFGALAWQLCDLTQVTEFLLSGEGVRAAARLDEAESQHCPGRRMAIVVQGPVAFGLSRMYQAHAARCQWKTQIFSSRSEARGWLMQAEKSGAGR